jgi:hypothetical protein
MIITLVALGICFPLAYFLVTTEPSWKDVRCRKTLILGTAFVVIASVFLLGSKWESYDTYLDIRSFYDATVEQYATAIEMYEDKAVIDLEKAAFTDLKYQGYQDNVAGFIMDLRNRIVEYNEVFVKKQRMKSNIVFSWLVVAPDRDMKIVSMKTAGNRKAP